MKGLVWNCKNLSWKFKNGEYYVKDSLLVFICFEKGDTHHKLKESVRRIKQLNSKRYNKDIITVFPFAHLSHNIMDINDSKMFFTNFISELSNSFTVKNLPFEIEKEVYIHLLPAKEDVSYFEY